MATGAASTVVRAVANPKLPESVRYARETNRSYADSVRREVRMSRSCATRLESLAQQWRATGLGEVIELLLAMHDRPRRR